MSNQRPRKVRMGSSRRQLDRTSLLAHDVTSEIQTDPRSMTAVDMDSVNPNYSEHGNQLDFKEPISETSEGLAFASKKCGNLIHPPTTFEIDAHTNQSRRVSPKPSQPQKEDMSGNRNENVVMIWSNDLTREQCKEFSENKESQMGMPHESCQKTTLQMSKPTWDDNMTPEVSQCSGVSWHPRLNSSLYSSPCQPLTDDLTNSPQQSSDSIIHKEVEREIRKEDSNNLAVSSTGTIAEGQEYLLQVGGICGDVPSLMKKEHEVSHDLNPLLKQSEHPTQSVVCPLLIEVPNQEEAEQEQITYTTPDSLDSTGNSVIVVESQPLLTMQYTVNPGNNQEMTIQDHLENTKRDHIFDLSELGHNMKEKSFSRVCESEQNSDGAAVDASGLDNDVERTEVASNQEQDGDLDMKSSRKKRRMGSSRRIGNQGKGGGGDHSGEIVESDFSTDFNKTNNDFETELKVEMKCDAESLEGGTLGTSTDKVDCLWLIPPQSEIKERGSEDIIERACKEIYTGGNIHLSPDISHGDVDKRKEDESEEKNEIVEKISRPYHEEDLCRSATDPQDKDIRPPGADFLMVDQNSLSKENAPHSLDINSSILFAPVSDIRDNDDKMDTAGQHQTALSSNVDRISGQGNHGSLPHVKDDDNQILRRRKMGSSRWTKGSATGSQKGSKKAHTTEDKEIEKDAVLSENISEGDPQKRILKDNEGPEKVVTAEEEANQIGGDTHQSMSEAPNIVRRKLGSNNMTGRMTPIQENTKERKEVESEVSEDRKIFKDELKMKVNKDKSTEQNGERSSENGVKPVNTTVSALPIELSNDLHVEGRRRKLGSQRKSRRQHHHDYPPESKDHGASRQISGDATLTFDTLNKCDRRANCFNVVMVGSSNVGKTSFMKRIQSGSFSPDFSASIGIDTCIHALPVDGREVMLQIWDTAGQERFHSISKQIFHKGQAFLLMYDITSSVSFTDVRYWISCIQESAGEEVIMLLLGNKSDCAGRKVTPSEGKLLAKEYNIDFNECSAATGEHIVSSIESLARKLTENYHKIEEDVVLQQQQQKKRCC